MGGRLTVASYNKVNGKIWGSFCHNTGKRLFVKVFFKNSRKRASVPLKNGPGDFLSGSPFKIWTYFYVTNTENFKYVQYLDIKNKNLFLNQF